MITFIVQCYFPFSKITVNYKVSFETEKRAREIISCFGYVIAIFKIKNKVK